MKNFKQIEDLRAVDECKIQSTPGKVLGEFVFAMLGEQFNVGDEVCGAGLSMRQKRD